MLIVKIKLSILVSIVAIVLNQLGTASSSLPVNSWKLKKWVLIIFMKVWLLRGWSIVL